jgi:hypothetical protein
MPTLGAALIEQLEWLGCVGYAIHRYSTTGKTNQ